MYDQLSALMEATLTFERRDREAMRSCQFLAQALRARAEFHAYRNEPKFKELAGQLDDRIANAAGTSGYAGLIR